jgi:hypothetical protein
MTKNWEGRVKRSSQQKLKKVRQKLIAVDTDKQYLEFLKEIGKRMEGDKK